MESAIGPIKIVLEFIENVLYFKLVLRYQASERLMTPSLKRDFHQLVNELPKLLGQQLKCWLIKSHSFQRSIVVSETASANMENLLRPHIAMVEGVALPRGLTEPQAVEDFKQLVCAAVLPICEELQVQNIQWLSPRVKAKSRKKAI